MRKQLLIILLLMLQQFDAIAKTPEATGLTIAIEMDKRNSGWVDQTSDLLMLLRNQLGQESKRTLRIRVKEVQNNGDKSLSVFDSPKDIKGTAFLSYTHALTPDDQWLYLPALKRVKRISSANKSGPFAGSEFAYEDLTSQEVEKYTYKWIRDETLDGNETLVIERYPAYKHSGYTRQVVWVDKNMYQPLKIDYYDRKDAKLKTLSYSDYQLYLGQHWRARKMDMVNHLTGKETTLIWQNYHFNNNFTDRDFDRNALKLAR